MINCPRCGKGNAADVLFCQSCGTRLAAGGAGPGAAPPSAPPPGWEPPPGDTGGLGMEKLRAAVQRLVADRAAEPGRLLPPPMVPAPPPAYGPRAVASNAEDSPFRLVVVNRDGTDGMVYSLIGSQIDIGRAEGDLLFDDPYLGGRHARIAAQGGVRVLTDLETRNGIYRRLRAPTDLNEGDEILIGKQVLRFEEVPEGERNLRPAVERGMTLFGTAASPPWGRLRRIAATGLTDDLFHLSRNEVAIGREQGDIIFADDEFMSRRHAQLSFRAGRRTLEDLSSSNGSFIRLRGPYALATGDQIRMGDVLLRFELG